MNKCLCCQLWLETAGTTSISSSLTATSRAVAALRTSCTRTLHSSAARAAMATCRMPALLLGPQGVEIRHRVLSRRGLKCRALRHRVLSRRVLKCTALRHRVLSSRVLKCRALRHRVLSRRVLKCSSLRHRVLSRWVLKCMVLRHRVLSRWVLKCRVLRHRVLSRWGLKCRVLRHRVLSRWGLKCSLWHSVLNRSFLTCWVLWHSVLNREVLRRRVSLRVLTCRALRHSVQVAGSSALDELWQPLLDLGKYWLTSDQNWQLLADIWPELAATGWHLTRTGNTGWHLTRTGNTGWHLTRTGSWAKAFYTLSLECRGPWLSTRMEIELIQWRLSKISSRVRTYKL